jgi:hypothetical protein
MNELEIREDPPCTPPRPNWRKRFLLGSLIALPLLLAVPFIYFILSCNQEFEQAVAEADWLDPGWRIPELEQKRAVIRDSENSGLALMAAKALMPPNWPFWDHPRAPEKGNRSEEELRELQDSLSDVAPSVQLDERQITALREELRRAERAVAAVRQVADLPRGRYPIHYSRDFVGTLLPYIQDARTFGNLLAYDVLLRAQDKDVDGALASCRGILNCGRSIGDEPTLISMLVRIALNALATKKVERALAQGEPSEAALSVIQQEFADEAEQPLLLIGVRGERGLMDGALAAMQDGELDPRTFSAMSGGRSDYVALLRIPGMVKSIRAALLKYNNRFVEIAKLPVEQQVARMEELRAAEQDLPQLARQIFAASIKTAAAFHQDQARLRCATVMVAVERYRVANNRWPDTLPELVPAYLPKVPLDPYDGAPLRYRRLSDGVVIYSVGADGKDNGGKLTDGRTREGIDVGFRLWDVSQRRQPAAGKAPELRHECD